MAKRALVPHTVEQVLSELERARDPQIAKIYARRNPEATVLGVRFGDMETISKKIAPDAALAAGLWASGSLEARVIALRVMPAGALTEAQADAWVRDLDFPTLADDFARVVYKTPFARTKMEAWTASEAEFVRRAGYSLLFGFAADPDSTFTDAEWLAWLDRIGDEIHQSPNWSRESMLIVPVAIGLRNEALHAPALATSSGFGKVEVFHGDKTNCKVQDPVKLLNDPRTKIKPY